MVVLLGLLIMIALSITFENCSKFYFEGERIRGTLDLNVDEPTEITTILANFVGLSNCLIQDCNNKLNGQVCQSTPCEVYVDDIITLFLASDKQPSIFEKTGHSFDFEYQLPYGLPTSLESVDGYVRYFMQVQVDTGPYYLKKTEYLTVMAKVDLNIDKNANERAISWQQSNQCMITSFCLPSKSVNIFLYISRRGYVPGENLKINAEIQNHYRAPITWVKAQLVQILKYHCSKTITKKHTISEIIRGCILPHEMQLWNEQCLIIPSIPPTTNPPKRLIHVRYKLYFIVQPSWKERCYILKKKIIIGAVPIMEFDSRKKGHGEGDVMNIKNMITSNLEPCCCGPHVVEEDGASLMFSPMYPVYTDICQRELQ